MKIKELVEEAHMTAINKGWWQEDRSPLEVYALIHSEVSEAVEEARLKFSNSEAYAKERGGDCHPGTKCWESLKEVLKRQKHLDKYGSEKLKPEGELIELADVMIRIADYCGQMNWDLEEAIRLKLAYNKTRPHRHGGKKY